MGGRGCGGGRGVVWGSGGEGSAIGGHAAGWRRGGISGRVGGGVVRGVGVRLKGIVVAVQDMDFLEGMVVIPQAQRVELVVVPLAPGLVCVAKMGMGSLQGLIPVGFTI